MTNSSAGLIFVLIVLAGAVVTVALPVLLIVLLVSRASRPRRVYASSYAPSDDTWVDSGSGFNGAGWDTNGCDSSGGSDSSGGWDSSGCDSSGGWDSGGSDSSGGWDSGGSDSSGGGDSSSSCSSSD